MDAPHNFALRRGACRTYYVQSLWADRAPIICLSEDEIARGEAELRVLVASVIDFGGEF